MNLTIRWVQRPTEAGFEMVRTERSEGTPQNTSSSSSPTNLDFPPILAHTGSDGPSVALLIGEPLAPDVRGPAIVQAPLDCESELAQGAIMSVDCPAGLGQNRFP